MTQAAALLVLRAHSGIHAGVGQEVGTVDLPIQRERVTNFPVVRGPSLKGAMRQLCEEKGLADVDLLFGPETSDHAGAVSVGDARLLLFPMRSLCGTFAWLSCPFAMKRLQRDLADCGLTSLCNLGQIPQPPTKQGLICKDSQIKFESRLPAAPGQPARIVQMVVVENYGIDALENAPLTAIADVTPKLHLDVGEVKKRLALVEDDLFQNFVTFGTEVVTRVHLDDTTKTVRKGQLWTEELLPAESVLTALILCDDARDRGRTKKSLDLLKLLCATIKGRFQIGGNETVGYGVCHAEWLGPIAMGGA